MVTMNTKLDFVGPETVVSFEVLCQRLTEKSRPALEPAHPAPCPMGMYTGWLFPGLNRQEPEASLPTSAELKQTWTYRFSPPYAFMA
jgi:hypothetical protein